MRERKTAAAKRPILGGPFRGVVLVDPSGNPYVLPFAGSPGGSGGSFLNNEGQFEEVAGPSSSAGYWAPVMAGDPLVETFVVTNSKGDAVMVFIEDPEDM